MPKQKTWGENGGEHKTPSNGELAIAVVELAQIMDAARGSDCDLRWERALARTSNMLTRVMRDRNVKKREARTVRLALEKLARQSELSGGQG